MQTSDARVTARIVRTDYGQTFTEYEVDGVAYGSLATVKSRLEGR